MRGDQSHGDSPLANCISKTTNFHHAAAAPAAAPAAAAAAATAAAAAAVALRIGVKRFDRIITTTAAAVAGKRYGVVVPKTHNFCVIVRRRFESLSKTFCFSVINSSLRG